MDSAEVKCAFCGKEFLRPRGRYNEAKKFGWHQYCSKECLSQHRTKKQWLSCENCGKRFQRVPHGISLHNYCSQSCAAVVNNSKHPKRKRQDSFRIRKRKKYVWVRAMVCLNCGKEFVGNSERKYCSVECRKIARQRYTPQELLGAIKQVAQKLNRTPARRELKGFAEACVYCFGSWNNAIIAASLQPNRSHSRRMYKRSRTKASDGHLCDSVSEAIIDNWLAENNFFHVRDVPYPETGHKADWGIILKGRTAFVEYFGLASDSPRYDRAVKRKKNLCKHHNIKLVAVYPQDIYPLEILNDNLRQRFNIRAARI